MQAYWLVHPIDGTATVYQLVDGNYGKPAISEMQGRLCAPPILAGLEIDWNMVGI